MPEGGGSQLISRHVHLDISKMQMAPLLIFLANVLSPLEAHEDKCSGSQPTDMFYGNEKYCQTVRGNEL